MRLYLIRHGETEYNATKQMQGWGEVPLNDAGIAQAAQLAPRMLQYPLHHIYSSDLRRAAMTTCIIAASTHTPITYDSLYRERNPGDLKDTFYQPGHPFFSDPHYEPPNGENAESFTDRIIRAFEHLIEKEGDTDHHIAVVTHGMVCTEFTKIFLGINPYEQPDFHWPNTALTICDYINGKWELIALANAEHLESPSLLDAFHPTKS